jgi:hypothetical protein
MRHHGSSIDAMRGMIGKAAKRTVEERSKGGIRFVPNRPAHMRMTLAHALDEVMAKVKAPPAEPPCTGHKPASCREF